MKVEIISTGTELLLGEIVNSNFRYLASRLNELGFDVLYETTVGDNYERMKQVISHAMQRADIVITSGGLGPTQGDITKEVTAGLLGRKLILDQHILADIEHFFSFRGVCMPQNNVKQAMLPEKSIALYNECGTAPGVFLEHDGGVIVNLPGPPRELKDMFEKKLAPMLIKRYGQQGIIYSHTLKSIGLGESSIAEKLADLISGQSNPTIAIYARQGEILIRITAKAAAKEEAKALTGAMTEKVRARLDSVYGAGDDTLPSVFGALCKKNKLTVALAESCTGGLLSSMLTDVAGSSEYFLGSVVSYGNDAKCALLDVEEAVLKEFGAVSEQVARQMAEGAARRFAGDMGVGITGIAGPGGGSEEKPVGTVYMAVYFAGDTTVYKYVFSGQRSDIKLRAVKTAIFNMIKTIKDK